MGQNFRSFCRLNPICKNFTCEIRACVTLSEAHCAEQKCETGKRDQTTGQQLLQASKAWVPARFLWPPFVVSFAILRCLSQFAHYSCSAASWLYTEPEETVREANIRAECWGWEEVNRTWDSFDYTLLCQTVSRQRGQRLNTGVAICLLCCLRKFYPQKSVFDVSTKILSRENYLLYSMLVRHSSLPVYVLIFTLCEFSQLVFVGRLSYWENSHARKLIFVYRVSCVHSTLGRIVACMGTWVCWMWMWAT